MTIRRDPQDPTHMPERASESSPVPRRAASHQKAARPTTAASSLRRLGAVYAAFVLLYAALHPLFMAHEPNAFPVLGNEIYYSLAESMEAAYFTYSLVAFALLTLVLSYSGLLPTRETALPALPAAPAGARRHRLAVGLALVLPWVILSFPQGPPIFFADPFHHGEKLIFQGRPFAETYRTFFTFKPLFYLKILAPLGLDNSIASYLAVYALVQRLGYIAGCFLILLVVRLIRGRYSVIPALLFLAIYPISYSLLWHRYWILDMQRLLFFLLFLDAVLLSLIYRRTWPLFVAGACVSVQYLASVEYASFATVALGAHIGLLFLRDRRAGLRAMAAAIAGALPLLVALLASGQLEPFIRFAAYTTRFPDLYGTPLLYRAAAASALATPVFLVVPVVMVWLTLLWAVGVLLPRAVVRRQLDDRSLWLYTAVLLAILTFKIGLGRSDVQHLYPPLLWAILPLLTIVLLRAPASPVPRFVRPLLSVAAVALVALLGLRAPRVPPDFVYDPSPRIRAYVPPRLEARLASLKELLAQTHSRSLFLFSDQPLFNYLLDLHYGLRHAVLHEILTDDVLALETEAFLRWAPDLVVWRTEAWSNRVDGIRTPVRDYRLAAAILRNYRPLVEREGWVFLARAAKDVDVGSLARSGFAPIGEAALQEVFDLGDMPYNIGRSGKDHGVFKIATLTLPGSARCVYRHAGRPILEFAGKPGTHAYALYPGLAPGYREAFSDRDSVICSTGETAAVGSTR